MFIVLITGVIFTIALGINSILVQQTKMMGEIGFSVVSFYAADSGAEKQLYDLFKKSAGEHQPSHQENLQNNASFITNASCGRDSIDCYEGIPKDSSCLAKNYCVDSLGKYQEVKRVLEIKY